MRAISISGTWPLRPGVSILPSSFARQPLQQGDAAPELAARHCRIPANGLSGRNVTHHAAMPCDARAFADGEVAGYSALAANHHEVVELGASGDPSLPDKNVAPTN